MQHWRFKRKLQGQEGTQEENHGKVQFLLLGPWATLQADGPVYTPLLDVGATLQGVSLHRQLHNLASDAFRSTGYQCLPRQRVCRVSGGFQSLRLTVLIESRG